MEEARKTSEYTDYSTCVWEELHKYRARCDSELASKFDTINTVQFLMFMGPCIVIIF
jgi:hypothetical protein